MIKIFFFFEWSGIILDQWWYRRHKMIPDHSKKNIFLSFKKKIYHHWYRRHKMIPDHSLSLMCQLTMNGLLCIISDNESSLMCQMTTHCLSYIMSDTRQFIVSNRWQWICLFCIISDDSLSRMCQSTMICVWCITSYLTIHCEGCVKWQLIVSHVYHVWYSTIHCIKQLTMNCVLAHWHVYHGSFICAPWLIHMCAMNSVSDVSHHIDNSSYQTIDNELCLMYHIWRCMVSYVSIDSSLSLIYHVWCLTIHCVKQMAMNCLLCVISDDSLSRMCQLTINCLWCITSYLMIHCLVCFNWQCIVSHVSHQLIVSHVSHQWIVSYVSHECIVSYVSIDNDLCLMYHIISDDSLWGMCQLATHCLSYITSTHCLSCVTSMNCLVCVNRQWFVSDVSHHIWWFIVSYVSNDNTLSLIHHVWHVDRKKPPPPGGFPIYYVPSSRPWVRGPPSKNLYQVLRGGSSYSRFLMREHSK